MTTEIKEIGNVFKKMYDNFLYRDLVYITSGAMILFSIVVVTNQQKELVELPSWIVVLGFFSCLYIGLLNQELWVYLRVFRYYPNQKSRNFVEIESKELLKIIALEAHSRSNNSLRIFERIVYVKTITSGFGSGLCTSTIVILLSLVEKFNITDFSENLRWCIVVVNILLISAAIITNKSKAGVQNRMTDELTFQTGQQTLST